MTTAFLTRALLRGVEETEKERKTKETNIRISERWRCPRAQAPHAIGGISTWWVATHRRVWSTFWWVALWKSEHTN